LTRLVVPLKLRTGVTTRSFMRPSCVTGFRMTGTNLVVLRLERREHGDALANDELGWEPIATSIVQGTSVDGYEMLWQGRLPVPDPLPSPLRVSVLELEAYRADERGADDLIGELMGANGARVLQGDRAMSHRVVFADATVVG
jgi:hypothetical protein